MAKTKGTETEKPEVVEGLFERLLREARDAKRTKKLIPTFIEFKEKGVAIVGKFLSRSQVGGGDDKKTYYQYIFETDGGLVKFHLGNVTDADAGNLMKEGCVYYIEFDGQESISGGRRVNKFIVERVVTEEEARIGGPDDQPF